MKRHDIRNKEVAGVMATIRGFLTRGRLAAIARRSNVDVDDVVQAVVTYHLTTKHGLAALTGEDGRRYCYVTARSRLLDAKRSQKRNPVAVEVREDVFGCVPPGALAFLVGMEEHTQEQRIARKLPRTTVTQARLEGSTYAEAAKAAGVHTSTAWRQFQKAMKQAKFLASQLSLFPEDTQKSDARSVETMGGFQP